MKPKIKNELYDILKEKNITNFSDVKVHLDKMLGWVNGYIIFLKYRCINVNIGTIFIKPYNTGIASYTLTKDGIPRFNRKVNNLIIKENIKEFLK